MLMSIDFIFFFPFLVSIIMGWFFLSWFIILQKGTADSGCYTKEESRCEKERDFETWAEFEKEGNKITKKKKRYKEGQGGTQILNLKKKEKVIVRPTYVY